MQVELHPALRGPGRRTLADFVPADRLRRWAAECGRSHEQFALKARADSGC